MSEENDDSSKTEEPSHKKLEEARKKGQLVSSREVNHFFMMLALTFFIMVLSPGVGQKTYELLAPYITQPDLMETGSAGFSYTMRHVAFGMMLIMALPILLTFLGAIAPAVVQNKWVFATEQIKPKLEKLSPLAGVKRLLGMKAIVEFLKSLLKISVVGAVAVSIALPSSHEMPLLLTLPKANMMEFTKEVAGRMMIAVCIMLFLLSLADYVYQRFSFMKSMRMTKQELKDEYKQQEGDPHIKQKLKAIRREKARQRMMANVPKADVIITNPTHYAVALMYDSSIMPAPKLVAKGSDDVAARIREVATKHKIPIIRNPPLARVLYDTTDIDQEIPAQHYQAVAKVIGYVYKLKGKVPQKPKGPITMNMPGKKK